MLPLGKLTAYQSFFKRDQYNMSVSAAVTTSKASGAISTIEIKSDDPHSLAELLSKIFKPKVGKVAGLKVGDILLGDIVDGDKLIDHVVVGCEADGCAAISCHGNPLIVEMIMALLKSNGVELRASEDFLAEQFAASSENTIEAEAELAQLRSVTLEGAKLIANQVDSGLGGVVKQWLGTIDSLDVDSVASECKRILARSKVADLIINGSRVVLAGPPNSGKSTLLNTFAGRQKAIVTDIAGTTRDWVSAGCMTGSLFIEFIDTAGLDADLLGAEIDAKSQEKTVESIVGCDMILFVVDASTPADAQMLRLDDKLYDPEKVIVVFNKCDLPARTTAEDVDFDYAASVNISAKDAEGIDDLTAAIRKVLGVADFDLTSPVCFTERQRQIIERINSGIATSQLRAELTELLNDSGSV
jgi:tRNA modification GTPase